MPFNSIKITNHKNIFWIYFTLGIIFLFSDICFSQTTIHGSIKGDLGHLSSASVLLKDSLSHAIIGFAYSDDNGLYAIKTKEAGKYNVVFSSLGYTSKTVPLDVKSNNIDIRLDVILDEKLESLDEVIIQSELAMSIKKDTITFKAKHFSLGNEQTVEDLLKKIPGISIDPNGTIKIGNQEIEKLMIDGDDLFEKGYRLLSKNMPAYPIETIEILQNYSNNRLLKGIEDSDKVALNLKLDEQSKHVWFGSIDASIGNDDFYQYKANLMNFGKKNKYYFFSNLNTIGYNATGDIQNLIRPFRFNELGSIGDTESVNSLLNLSSNHLNLKESRTNFNNAE